MQGDSAHKITGTASDTSMLMKIVGRFSKTLLAPADLRRALKEAGETDHFRLGSILFRAGDKNRGIFLVCGGRVRLQVPGAPHLDRTFSAGSILGLPSTFIGKPYSLTAACVTDCEVAHVGKKAFLDLMTRRLDLCREATEILSNEVAFIFSALGERSRETCIERSIRASVRIAR
jgi:CRP-like cAMP-binding protein